VIYTSYYLLFYNLLFTVWRCNIRDVPLLKTDKYRAKIHKTYYRRIKTDKFIFKKRLYIIAGQKNINLPYSSGSLAEGISSF
jgi:hypothetical protein